MALIICPECGKEYSDKASQCPNCGCPTSLVAENATSDAQIEGTAVSYGENDSAIYQEAQENPRKKNKGAIIIIAIIVILAIAGVITYKVIDNKKKKSKFASAEEYIESAKTFYLALIMNASEIEDIGNSIAKAWKENKYDDISKSVNKAMDSNSTAISEVEEKEKAIASMYKDLLSLPDANNQELQEIKEAIKTAYKAYQELSDCVLNPFGKSYSEWRTDFSNTDTAGARAVNNLGALLK